ncbi:MAG: UDP-N-acetylmuramate dehydrogenase [Chloroflexota bacterium]
MNEALITELRAIAPVKLDEPMSKHTTWGIGGRADVFIAVKTEDQLRAAFAATKKHGAEVFIFGSGSNILVGDGGIRGVVIENKVDEVVGPEKNGHGYKVRVGSGMSFASLARRLATSGYAGVEWACGIPGSLGGAVVTNAGAYGQSLADILAGARLTNDRGDVLEMAPVDLDLSYRASAYTSGKLKDTLVLSVDLRVQQGDAAALKAKVKAFDQQRKGAQPPGRNCGSVFQNPEGHAAWQLVDEAGLREHRIGNAQFSKQHSNFIQNLGGAKASDVVALVRLAQERIRENSGIEMHPEVAFIGEFTE